MIQTVHNSAICPTMELFNEIDDVSDLFLVDRNTKLDTAADDYQDLQAKYSSLHENYAKEIENSKKVEKCLLRCLKFYSKLCKKYEAQQKTIADLEARIKEKMVSLEESLKTQERMMGLIEVYKCERKLYSGAVNENLRRDKEVLLDICCRLISESVKTNNVRNLANLIVRKFRRDLDDNKINILKGRNITMKTESESGLFDDIKPSNLFNLKREKLSYLDENILMTDLKEEKCVGLNGANLESCGDEVDLSVSATEKQTDGYLHVNKSHEGVNEDEAAPSPEDDGCGNLDISCPSDLPPLIDATVLEHMNAQLESHHGDIEKKTTEKTTQSSLCKGAIFELRTTDLENHISPGTACSRNQSASELPFRVDNEVAPEEVFSHGNLSSAASRSIFDIPPEVIEEHNGYLNEDDFDVIVKSHEKIGPRDAETFLCFNTPVERKEGLMSGARDSSVDKTAANRSEDLAAEEDLYRIFSEMSHVRVLSPIKELNDSLNNFRTCKNVSLSLSSESSGKSENACDALQDQGQKRSREENAIESCGKVKRLKEDRGERGKRKCNLLDSILSAMSVQNEEFKQNAISGVPATGEPKMASSSPKEAGSCRFGGLGTRTYSRKDNLGESRNHWKKNQPLGETKVDKRDKMFEKLVTDEIKNFVSSAFPSKEDAGKSVKKCLSVLANKSGEIIAKSIVAIVLENVEEDVEVFERPAPPLTRTQHRLIVLLSVLRTFDPDSEKITPLIMSMIAEKLFPDNFFWPDDCVETACRFYTGLCKWMNDSKALWKFCLQAMTDMKQRSCLVVFTALKTWPDVLHDASTLKNNILAVTIVNIFLHMPKTEGLRNLNQKKKLMALKHLLMNFYRFKVEDTIEEHTKKVLDSTLRGEAGSEKSLVLISQCREKSWTCKNVLYRLREFLVEWAEDKREDSVVSRILAVIKQIVPFLKGDKDDGGGHVKEMISCLSRIMVSGKMSHAAELDVVHVLLELKNYPEARRVIREWVPKSPIGESLRNEIVNVSAENILRELKFNRRKESSGKKNFGTPSKKTKGKKGKGKLKGKGRKRKRKSNEMESGVRPTPGVA